MKLKTQLLTLSSHLLHLYKSYYMISAIDFAATFLDLHLGLSCLNSAFNFSISVKLFLYFSKTVDFFFHFDLFLSLCQMAYCKWFTKVS